MKEYKIVKIRCEVVDTENLLNSLARNEWEVVCSYARSNLYIILQRTRK